MNNILLCVNTGLLLAPPTSLHEGRGRGAWGLLGSTRLQSASPRPDPWLSLSEEIGAFLHTLPWLYLCRITEMKMNDAPAPTILQVVDMKAQTSRSLDDNENSNKKPLFFINLVFS